jgi:hypothetical protein
MCISCVYHVYIVYRISCVCMSCVYVSYIHSMLETSDTKKINVLPNNDRPYTCTVHCGLYTESMHGLSSHLRVIPSGPSLGALDGKKKRKTKRKLPPCSSLLRTLLSTPLRYVQMYQHHRPPPFTTPNKNTSAALSCVVSSPVVCYLLNTKNDVSHTFSFLIFIFHLRRRGREGMERGDTPHHTTSSCTQLRLLSSPLRPRQDQDKNRKHRAAFL